jgi:hypothetical protein
MNYFLHNKEKPPFVSPGVISITPNRNLDSPKVIFVTLGVREGYFAILVGYCPIRDPYSTEL